MQNEYCEKHEYSAGMPVPCPDCAEVNALKLQIDGLKNEVEARVQNIRFLDERLERLEKLEIPNLKIERDGAKYESDKFEKERDAANRLISEIETAVGLWNAGHLAALPAIEKIYDLLSTEKPVDEKCPACLGQGMVHPVGTVYQIACPQCKGVGLKRKCVKCGGETGPGDPRCMTCIYEAGKEQQRKDDDHRAAWKDM